MAREGNLTNPDPLQGDGDAWQSGLDQARMEAEEAVELLHEAA